jgi:hypothetical protein
MYVAVAFLLLLLLVFGVATTIHFILWVAIALLIVWAVGLLARSGGRRSRYW